MSNSSHLKALIKKNLLIYKSTFILTIIELLFPILVIFLFWKLRTLFKIENITIEDDIDYYYDEGILIQKYQRLNYYYPFIDHCHYLGKFIAIIGNYIPAEMEFLFDGESGALLMISAISRRALRPS